jgi:hypothetical protein
LNGDNRSSQDLRSAARKRFLACGSMVLPVYLFALYERKNRNTKEEKAPLRMITLELPHNSYT